MDSKELESLIGLEPKDYESVGALSFENLVCENLIRHGRVERQVRVPDRGDGRRGRIDIVFLYKGRSIPIEIDRKSVRDKSRFKVSMYNPYEAFCLTRSPFAVTKIYEPAMP